MPNFGIVVSNEDAVNAEKRLRDIAHGDSDKNNGKRRALKRSASCRKGGMQIEDRFNLHRFNAQANDCVPKS